MKPSVNQVIRDNWKHLRVPFQLTLAPIFLWGYFVSGARPEWRIVPAFIAFHFFLYTGITAFNSYYDRDEGPIGGLERPPTIHESLLPLSIWIQVLGLGIALLVGPAFTAIYVVFVILGVLYSYPGTRWKANVWLSTLVVCGGQGALGFLAGWAVARGDIGSAWSERGFLGSASAALTTFAMYPLTQVYQVDEDARRGDRTLCVVFGAEGGLRISQAAMIVAGCISVLLALRYFSHVDAAILAVAFAALAWRVGRFRNQFASLTGSEAFHAVLRLSYGTSAAFTLFTFARLARW
jgi:1,4-dihydroxy-2-naphthoate octaprenyltransferase